MVAVVVVVGVVVGVGSRMPRLSRRAVYQNPGMDTGVRAVLLAWRALATRDLDVRVLPLPISRAMGWRVSRTSMYRNVSVARCPKVSRNCSVPWPMYCLVFCSFVVYSLPRNSMYICSLFSAFPLYWVLMFSRMWSIMAVPMVFCGSMGAASIRDSAGRGAGGAGGVGAMSEASGSDSESVSGGGGSGSGVVGAAGGLSWAALEATSM